MKGNGKSIEKRGLCARGQRRQSLPKEKMVRVTEVVELKMELVDKECLSIFAYDKKFGLLIFLSNPVRRIRNEAY